MAADAPRSTDLVSEAMSGIFISMAALCMESYAATTLLSCTVNSTSALPFRLRAAVSTCAVVGAGASTTFRPCLRACSRKSLSMLTELASPGLYT